MIATIKQKNFFLLWFGGLVSMIGNWIMIAALPFHIFEMTGSALATSGFLMAYVAPGILFSSLAGVFADRWDRKRLMVIINILETLVVLLMLLVRSVEWIWLIYLVIFIESSLGQFFRPAENALLPTLVGEEHLVSANALNALNDNLARLVGPAIGGALLGTIGFSSIVIVDAITYLAAAILISLVPVSRKPDVSKPPQVERELNSLFAQTWRDWSAGLSFVARRPILKNVFIIMGIAMFGDAILSAIIVVFVQTDMQLSPAAFGWVMTARGLGGILGSMVVGQIGRKLKPEQMIAFGLVLSSICILVIVNFPLYWVLIAIMFAAGIPLIAFMVNSQTLMQMTTEDAFRGRLFGFLGTTSMLLIFLGSAFAGGLADKVGASVLLNSSWVFYMLAGLLAIPLLVKEKSHKTEVNLTAI